LYTSSPEKYRVTISLEHVGESVVLGPSGLWIDTKIPEFVVSWGMSPATFDSIDDGI
jgi:hypothetical protein